jgi:hypothetical protein
MLAVANFVVYHMATNGVSMDFNPDHYATPNCESPQQYCLTNSPAITNCIQNTNLILDPQNRNNFDSYFNHVAKYITMDVTGKTPEEILIMRANYKITLLRYIIFIQSSLKITQTLTTTQGI